MTGRAETDSAGGDPSRRPDLAGLRVVDISQQLPGPYATALLAELGAEVTKVEPPAGDPSRSIDPDMYALVNRGKTVVHLDLKSSEGVGELHRMVRDADVFLEGFRPGVATRLGAGWEELSGLNPRLVYCSISACGQTGPYAMAPMHDLNLQGLAGLDPGPGIGVPWVDLGTATSAALAIVSAWAAAQRSGRGKYLDGAMLDTAVLWGRVKASAAGRVEPTYGIFETSGGERVAVAILEDHIWTRLCEAFGWADFEAAPELSTYEGRVAAAEAISRRLSKECALRTAPELMALADRYDLPLTPVEVAPGTAAHDQLLQRDLDRGAARALPIPPSC